MGTFDSSVALLSPSLALQPQAFIAPEAKVEGDCVVKSGAHICAGVDIASGCYIGANVVFVEADDAAQAGTVVRRQVWIGANSTIYAGLTIAAKAVVRPGSVVTRSVPPGAIVEGNPAVIVGYVDTDKGPASAIHVPSAANGFKIESTPVKGVTVHHFPVIHDLRGDLTVGEFDRHVPFKPLRYFMVFGVPSREIRGEHAHHRCHQFLICLRGSCAVVADDGARKVEVTLDSPQRGLYLPPMTWGIQYKYSPDAMLMVFASDYYDAADYIRDYAAFIERVGEKEGCAMSTPRLCKAERLQGKSLVFRNAGIDDAAFILSLRTDQRNARHLSHTSAALADQIAWLHAYAQRDYEAYFVIASQAGENLGTVRLYDARGDSFCWGSWILPADAPSTAAIESALMVYAYAIDTLGFRQAHFTVNVDNERVCAFHERFGAQRVSQSETEVHYTLGYEAIRAAMRRYARFLPTSLKAAVAGEPTAEVATHASTTQATPVAPSATH